MEEEARQLTITTNCLLVMFWKQNSLWVFIEEVLGLRVCEDERIFLCKFQEALIFVLLLRGPYRRLI